MTVPMSNFRANFFIKILAPKLHSGAAIEIVKKGIFAIDLEFTLDNLFFKFSGSSSSEL